MKPDPTLDSLPGIGVRRLRALEEAGILTAEDLAWYLPFRYEDRSSPVDIKEVWEGQTVLVRVEVRSIKTRKTRRKRLSVTEALLSDETGNLYASWFNQPYMETLLPKGSRAYLYGNTSLYSVRGGLRLQLDNPEVERIDEAGGDAVHTDRIVPVYRKLGDLKSRGVRTLLFKTLDRIGLEEVLPEVLLREESLPERKDAFRHCHFPVEGSTAEELMSRRTPFQKRLIFEELLGGQLVMASVRARRRGVKGVRIRTSSEAGDLLRSILPFRLTDAQKRVFREVTEDLSLTEPMYRMLQGDVGCGKTVVANLAMVLTAHDRFQAAYMAPTEILARQQHERLAEMVKPLGCEVTFLSASVKGRKRKECLEALRSGESMLAVGTHSLFQEEVSFHRLGLVVIDEQHRFGVLQRAAMVAKGEDPNVLVMSATPIPRTLALTVYGDLDLSVIDQMPMGRKEIVTAIRDESARPRIEAFIRGELDERRQVFIVYPLVEETEATDTQAAVQAYERLSQGAFRGYPMALLHGRMAAEEKQDVMERLRCGEVRLLVATTVVEVGVDLPEASVMMVERADRFGLAQLHQLRGRVGRSGQRAYCILMRGDECSDEGVRRLSILEKTLDGFEIAEEDLKIRGPGDAGGIRQWGGGGFRIAHPLRDFAILSKAREWAEKLLVAEIELAPGERERLKRWISRLENGWAALSRIG